MRVQTHIIDIDYRIEEGEVYLRLYGKTENKNILAYDYNFLPYFYIIPEKNADTVLEEIKEKEFKEDGEKLPVKKLEKTEKEVEGEKKEVVKAYTNIPANVPKLKNQIWDLETVKKCREFDIPFYKRYLIDKDLRPGHTIEIEGQKEEENEDFDTVISINNIKEVEDKKQDYKLLSFDLEVYKDEIIMASIVGEDFTKVLSQTEIEREYIETVEDEKELVERLVEIVNNKDADVITGYNTDEFDFKRLRDAANRNNITLSMGRDGERMKFNRRGRFSSARLKGRMHLDLYPFVSHILSPSIEAETLDLDSIAEELLGENKDEMSWEQMKKAWEKKEELEKFADYCLKDSQLAFKLSEELFPQIMEISKIVGTIPFDTCRLTYGQLTENFLLREASKRDILAPNRPSQDRRNKRRREGAYSGGFVYTPESGLYENIALFDFRSLYPTVMVAHNISPDTLNIDDCDDRFEIEELGHSFCQDEKGFFPELIEGLVEERYRLKNKMKSVDKDSQEYQQLYNRQQAEKLLANSYYGYLGYNGARWYSRESAEATTYLGRKYIEETIETAEKMGFEVVYGDTDSVFLKKENIREEMDEFLNQVNNDLPEFMELEFEGFFKRGFYTSTDSGEGAKKKYALMSEDGEMKITGFEQVRRDWSPIAKETQEKVLRKVLQDKAKEAADIVKETIEELKSGEVELEKLHIYTTLTKEPDEYDTTAPHVEAAKKAIDRGEEISPETTISYVITSGTGNISSRAEILKYADSYDADYYIENQILPVSLRVLKVFGYTGDQLQGKGKQSGLDQFH